ncbi:MAG: hypothetical protein AB1631_26640 [Acidobacteriota bacterium]
MDEQTYNDQLITEYLLGSLSEEETERLDELSFTDDQFAERLRAVENDLVDSYARGELSGSRLERFESFYLASPVRREKARFAQVFQTLASPTVVAEREIRKRAFADRSVDSRWRRFFTLPVPLQWGLAAAALLIAAGGWLAFENLRMRERIDQAQAERAAMAERERELQVAMAEKESSASEKEKELASLRERLSRLEAAAREPKPPSLPDRLSVLPFELAPQSRGVGQMPTLSIPLDTDYIALQLELETGDHFFYRAELKSLSDGRVLWRSGKLKTRSADKGRSIVVTLRSALLKSERYILEVSAIANGRTEAVASYPFSIIKQ